MNINRRVLVTGASRGIGWAIAAHMASLGAQVVGTATGTTGIERITNQAHEAGLNIQGVVLQQDEGKSIERCLQEVSELMGGIDVLVNNAGVTRDALMIRQSDEHWDDVLSTNLTGPFKLCRGVVRGMIKQRWGRIISLGSVVGSMGNPGQVNYCAAKAGLVGMSKALAHEVAQRGVTVNVVAPGFIATDMTEHLNEKQKEHIMQSVPMQRMGEPTDIAAAVAFLASDAAGYITGETLHVNGGMLMG